MGTNASPVVRLAGDGAADTSSYFVVDLAPTNVTCILILSGSATGGAVHEQSGSGQITDSFHRLSRFPVPERWSRVEVDVNRATLDLSVLVDGQPAFVSSQVLGQACGGAGGVGLSKRDAEGMAACYADDVRFSDPVFQNLEGDRAKNMWRMLCERGKDRRIEFARSTPTIPRAPRLGRRAKPSV